MATITLTFQDRGDHHVWQIQVPGGNHKSMDPIGRFKVEPECWEQPKHIRLNR